jgi:hypothetical protein
VSLYSDLLRLALDDPAVPLGSTSVDELMARVRTQQDRLALAHSRGGTYGPGSAESVVDLVTLDVAIVELCRILGIEQSLTDPWTPPDERERLLELIDSRLGPEVAHARSVTH